jgi:hypothetical protein
MNDYALMPEEQVRLVEIIIEDTNGQPITFDDFHVLVQRKSEFWPAILSWMPGVLATNC